MKAMGGMLSFNIIEDWLEPREGLLTLIILFLKLNLYFKAIFEAFRTNLADFKISVEKMGGERGRGLTHL